MVSNEDKETEMSITSYNEGRILGGEIWAKKDSLSFEDYLILLEDTRYDLLSGDLSVEDSYDKIDGMFSFIMEKEVEGLNVKKFYSDLATSKNDGKYDSYIRIVDRLLPPPGEHLENMKGDAVEIPVDLRPHIYDVSPMVFEGVIGRFYFQESGMNMWFPHCDVYSEDDPDELLEEGVNLYDGSFVTSEILLALQAAIDSGRDNKELEETIKKSIAVENVTDNVLYDVLAKHNLAVISLKACGRQNVRCREYDRYGDLQYVFLADGAVWGDVKDFDDIHFAIELLPSTWNYDFILQELKAAVNVAKGKSNATHS